MRIKRKITSTKGEFCARLYILAAFLTQTKLSISGFPANGLPDYLTNLLRFVTLISTKTEIKVSKGTLKIKPGIVSGDKYLEHEVVSSRGITYWLEFAILLLLYTKKDSVVRFTNCTTNSSSDISVDWFKGCTIPLISRFIDRNPDQLRLEVIKRGNFPRGGGEVVLYVPFVKHHLKPLQLTDFGMIKRVRGVAFAARMDPISTNRMVDSAKTELQRILPNIWIATDYHGKKTSGPDPGYSLYIQAETDTGFFLGTEYTAHEGAIPEEVGKHTVHTLFEQLKLGPACVDRSHQWLVFLLMSLTSEDVNKVRVAKLTKYSIFALRIIKEALGVEFMFQEDHDSGTIVCICVGSNKRNLTRNAN